MLDVTAHKAFFHTFSGWLWAALVLCALLSVLGWLLVRSGLRPLREVWWRPRSHGRVAARAHPDDSTPAELQQLVQAFNAMLARLEDAFVRIELLGRRPQAAHATGSNDPHRGGVDARAFAGAVGTTCIPTEELQRMSRMIDDMLFLAKADNGLIVPDAKPVALEQLCATARLLPAAGGRRGVRSS